jgi:hypothetical protein
MDDEEFLRRALPVQILPEGGIQGSCPFRLRSHREESGRLVDNDQAFIFKDNHCSLNHFDMARMSV